MCVKLQRILVVDIYKSLMISMENFRSELNRRFIQIPTPASHEQAEAL